MIADDELWLESLAGRSVGDSHAVQEGLRLRVELRLRAAGPVVHEQPLTSLAREERLLGLARREHLLPSRGLIRQASPWLALAAGLAVAAFGLLRIWSPDVDTQVVRGASDGVVRMEVASPADTQKMLLAELKTVGIEGRGYEMLGRYGVDADWPASPTAEQRGLLEKLHLPAPQDQALRVEYVGGPP
jgi:hypothetical protein